MLGKKFFFKVIFNVSFEEGLKIGYMNMEGRVVLGKENFRKRDE